MAYSINTRNAGRMAPIPGAPGGQPRITAVSNSVAAIATCVSGLWSGPRNTFAYSWYRSASFVGAAASNASFSYQSAGTHTCKVTVTNPYGSKSFDTLPITIL